MGLSDKERKILWTKAGNRCSFNFGTETCDQLLVYEAGQTDSIIGDECHIVGPDEGSPRYVPDYADIDSGANRILLCRNHHRVVDANEAFYTVEVVQNMKRRHEEKTKHGGQTLTIQDAEFVTEAKNADRAVGMEVNRAAQISNVKAALKAENVREAIGFSTNQGLTIASPKQCASCGSFLPRLFVGSLPPMVTCLSCGHENTP